MTVLITPGPIQLAVLNGVGGSKLKTLILPVPDRKNPEVEWITKKIDQDLVDGSERTRILGYIPSLKVKWSPYDDRTGQGLTIGTADGNRPSLEQLLTILSATPGTLKVSLGTTGTPLGFIVGRADIDKIPYHGRDFADLTVTFRGRDVYSTRTLGAF